MTRNRANTGRAEQILIEELKARVKVLEWYEDVVKESQHAGSMAEKVSSFHKSAHSEVWCAEEQELYWAAQNSDVRITELQTVVDEYKALGERVLEQDGNWLMLHAGTIDWLVSEFKRINSGKSHIDLAIEYAAKHATKEDKK